MCSKRAPLICSFILPSPTQQMPISRTLTDAAKGSSAYLASDKLIHV
jgi:hypothetical protein